MILDNLNKPQREAAEYIEGPLLILAGAGSGKTSTMTHRIAYMIELGISKYNILAVTFTNKAAKEMRDRVEDLVGDLQGMWITTFHSMCLRMLRGDAIKIGYSKNFIIYDTTDQKTLVKNILKGSNISDKEFPVRMLLSVISKCKENLWSPQDYMRNNGEDFRTKTIADIYEEYNRQLKANNAMDFDDLLLNCWKLFKEHPDVLEAYQKRFRYVMVDEYQDTNYLQYMLVKALAEDSGNLCVVGDDDQCIYQWRGADIRNILDFEKDFPQAKVVKLEQNYRSKGNILAGAHSVITNNKGRKRKKLWTDKDPGNKITYYRADTERDEARYIAQEIKLLQGSGYKWSDFAILYRTNAQSRVFEQGFVEKEIPYRILSGMRYYDRKEIKDLIAYMRLIVNPQDDISLRRIINEPKRGVGAKSLEKLIMQAEEENRSLFSSLLEGGGIDQFSGKAGEKVREMVELIRLISQERDNLTVSQIYDELLVKTGYIKALEKEDTVEAEGRIENLMEFKSEIADYEKDAETSELSDFMEKIALMSEVDNHDDTQNAVVLMTMHSSKGLEFPIVFLPGMEDGLFPGHRAMDSTDGMEEERRLCYVGMTRAKERLFLTGSTMRTIYGRTDYMRESQFLREIDPKLIEGDGVYVGKKERQGLGVPTGSKDGYSKSNPTKPFDMVSYARQLTEKNILPRQNGEEFHTGDKVNHRKFGKGLVIEEDAQTLTVIFDEVGRKKLAKGIAHLTAIR